MEARLTDIEIKLTYIEDHVDTLNRLVIEQAQEIGSLQREMARLREQVASQPAEARSLRDEIPPHY